MKQFKRQYKGSSTWLWRKSVGDLRWRLGQHAKGQLVPVIRGALNYGLRRPFHDRVNLQVGRVVQDQLSKPRGRWKGWDWI
jgi:hypothetical protein